MDILNNHSDFNKWQVMTGNKANKQSVVDGYLNLVRYAKNLKADLTYNLKQLIVEDINAQKNIRIIGINNIDQMIDTLNTLNHQRTQQFQDMRKKDIFKAFRLLHKLTYG